MSHSRLTKMLYSAQVGLTAGISLCLYVQEMWPWAAVAIAICLALWTFLIATMIYHHIEWLRNRPLVVPAGLGLWYGMCKYFHLELQSNGMRVLPVAVNITLLSAQALPHIKATMWPGMETRDQGSEDHELGTIQLPNDEEAQSPGENGDTLTETTANAENTITVPEEEDPE